MRRRDESGQTSLLIVGFSLVLLLAVGVVVDASAAYLQRQAFSNLADGAALAGADEVRGDPVYSGGLDDRITVGEHVARQAVARYLHDIGAYDDHPGLRWSVRVRDDAVVVRLTGPLDLPITAPRNAIDTD